MALSRIATLIGAALLSKGGRRVAGRHAGKLALATLAFELWSQHRRKKAGVRPAQSQRQGGRHPGRRWSGRRG